MLNTTSTQISFDEVAGEDIAAEFGTPTYVFEAVTIAGNVQRIRAAMSGVDASIVYSCKTHSSVAILRFLRGLGVGVDACSPGDLAFAALAGYGPQEIVYTSCSMTSQEIGAVAAQGIRLNSDSLSQLETYSEKAAVSPTIDGVGVRVNPGILAGFHPHVQAGNTASKFGVHRSQLSEARRIAVSHGLKLDWLHVHLGSDIWDCRVYSDALQFLLDSAKELPEVNTVDLGGGFGVALTPDMPRFDWEEFSAMCTERLSSFRRETGRTMSLVIEPGASLVADAGHLLTTVVELKTSGSTDPSEPVVAGVDASVNHLISVLLYGSEREVFSNSTSVLHRRYQLVGNLMQAGDVFRRDVCLPQLSLGDLLVIRNTGAYAASRASTFNNRPRPAEVLVSDGKARLIRRRETIHDLLAQQVV